jgi:hypothetical protein
VRDGIPDRAVYAAVMFTRRVIREAMPTGVVIYRAAKYKIDKSADPQFVGQVAGTYAHRRRSQERQDQ